MSRPALTEADRETFALLCRTAREWAERHNAETGHSVWTHFRALNDFCLGCFECQTEARRSR